jgi:hypothetical protein
MNIKKKSDILFKVLIGIELIGAALVASSCIPATVTTPVSSETPYEVMTTPTASVAASPTELPSCWEAWHSVQGSECRPGPPTCWETIAIHYGPYGPPRALEGGPENGFWALYNDALIWQPDNGEASIFIFQEMLGCDKCWDIINGSMAVSTAGDAWLGMTTGVLVVDRQGAWKQIPVGEILPIPNNTSDVHVLLSDQNGNMWVSNRNRLCYHDGAEWVCNVLDEVVHILSAVSGKADQIWFGASWTIIILFERGEYSYYDLAEMSPSMHLSDIGSMAYDPQTDTLWAASLDPPRCVEGQFVDTNGVIQRNANGDWTAYKKSLFAREPGDLCWYTLTSIAVTPDGKVWLGMFHRHGLAYFDGLDWRTLAGKKLPYISDTRHPPRYDDGKCVIPGDITVDLLVTRDGDLLVATYSGIFKFDGFHNE